MNIRIDPASPVPIYLQILDSLKISIASGELKSGDRLPSVRELALQLRLNPRTISNAYRELLTMGLAESQKGVGLFLTENCRPFAGVEAITQLRERINEAITFGRELGFSGARILQETASLIRDLEGGIQEPDNNW